MKIGILGATGAIGHHTANAVLERGHELVVIHRAYSNLESIKDLTFSSRIFSSRVFSSRIGDLNDRASLLQAFTGLDAIINCAAYYPTKPRALQAEVKIAVSQMENFYQACSQADIQKIVYLGAAIALPKHPQALPGTEELIYTHAPQNKNPYLQVKWKMDRLAREQAKNGLPVVIAIPSMCFGEFDYRPSTGKLIVEIANGTIPGYIRGDRNIIYTGDAGKGLMLACEGGKPGERYLFTGTNLSMDELVKRIAELAGVSPPKIVIPLPIAKAICKFQETKYQLFGGKLPKISSSAIAVMASGQFLDGSKAQKELGFQSKVDLNEAISRAINWFRLRKYIK